MVRVIVSSVGLPALRAREAREEADPFRAGIQRRANRDHEAGTPWLPNAEPPAGPNIGRYLLCM